MKHTKRFTAVCAAMLAGCLLCACTIPAEEPFTHEILYTIDEEADMAKDANDASFSIAQTEERESPLKGKRIYWLGSSVTYGANSQGESMADFMAALTGCESKKDAVSGTTIFCDNATENTGAKSYTSRLTNSTVFDKTEKVDAFVCQISTNDAMNNRLSKRGTMLKTIPFETDECILSTTLGGVEYIIRYVIDTWDCPVYFYSGAYFGDTGDASAGNRTNGNPKGSEYGKLVEEVKEIAAKWTEEGFAVSVIDLYGDEAFNSAVSDEYYAWCRQDAIHPKRAGYRNWWTPYIEHCMIMDLNERGLL